MAANSFEFNHAPLFGECVRFQFFQGDELERGSVRRFKINRSRAVMIQRTFPASHAHAPPVARLQPRETPFRMWRDQIISIEHREIEKFLRHFYADGVKPNIFGSGAAKTVAVKSSHRIAATTFQFSSQNIRWHGAILALDIHFVNCWIGENMQRMCNAFLR